MLDIGFAAAFAGGVLSLLSPCSALLLPAFLAYAFQSPGALLGRTVVFFAGLVTVLVPLGTGMGSLGAVLNAHRGTVVSLAGVVLIALGVLQLSGRGFGLPAPARLQALVGGDSNLSVYALGLTYAFAGFCSGPILGAVLTVAASSGTPWRGAGLLAVYALGMAAPAFVLALLWQRLPEGWLGALRGGGVQVAGRRLHVTSALSGLLLLAVGVLFLAFNGTVGLAGLYGRVGATDLALRLNVAVQQAGGAISDPAALTGGLLLSVAVGAAWWWRRRGGSASRQP